MAKVRKREWRIVEQSDEKIVRGLFESHNGQFVELGKIPGNEDVKGYYETEWLITPESPTSIQPMIFEPIIELPSRTTIAAYLAIILLVLFFVCFLGASLAQWVN